jgi:tripartite-type tricarboxylate transporter receptor subunit TctC
MKSPLQPLILGLVTIGVVFSAIAQPIRAECPQAVKIIVSYPPGSPDDVIGRILAQKLSEGGGRFYVENLPGAGGMMAPRRPPERCLTAAPWSSAIRTSSFSSRSAKNSLMRLEQVAAVSGGDKCARNGRLPD